MVILGAGVGGLAAALALQARGVPCVVFERDEGCEQRRGYGLTLSNAAALAALEQITSDLPHARCSPGAVLQILGDLDHPRKELLSRRVEFPAVAKNLKVVRHLIGVLRALRHWLYLCGARHLRDLLAFSAVYIVEC